MDISSMLEVEVKEGKDANCSKKNVPPGNLSTLSKNIEQSPVSQQENNFYKLMFDNDMASVRFRRIHCTACDIHIGSAPASASNMTEHPILKTLLCSLCRDFYGDGTFEQGDDATDMFCRWCANGGNLYCCSYCSNTFCYKCIKRNFDPMIRKKIEADEKWKCFVCDPTDLYPARGICWALIQHIQTVTRILENDTKMTPEEKEEKMNFDESTCCPRRRRRKRRRTSSNSEEEDETYAPSPEEIDSVKRQVGRPRKSLTKTNYPNGTPNRVNTVVPVKNRMILPRQNVITKLEFAPLIACEQTLIERNDATVNPDGVIVPTLPLNPDASLPSRFDLSVAQTSLYNSTVDLAYQSPPSNQINKTTPVNKVYQTVYRPQTPMVSIPNQNSNQLKRRLLVSKSKSNDKNMTITPNIIDLDSDSDEPIIIESSNRVGKNVVNTTESPSTSAVPVLVPREQNDGNDNTTKELETTSAVSYENRTFDHRLIDYNLDINLVLKDIKYQFNRLLNKSDSATSKDLEIKEAYRKTKKFCDAMRKVVGNLATISNRIVREYNSWKRIQKPTEKVCRRVENPSNKIIDIPLEMICDAESDSDNDEIEMIEASELIESTNILDSFVQKKTCDRGVGNHLATVKDQSVQIYDIVRRDYEKCIGYSLLTKCEIDLNTRDTTDKTASIHNEYFGKYEEQFIFHLQRLEEQGIETEDEKGVYNLHEVQEDFNTDVSSPLVPISQNDNNCADKLVIENKNKESQVVNKPTSKAVEELEKMVSKLTDDLEANKNTINYNQSVDEEYSDNVDHQAQNKTDEIVNDVPIENENSNEHIESINNEKMNHVCRDNSQIDD